MRMKQDYTHRVFSLIFYTLLLLNNYWLLLSISLFSHERITVPVSLGGWEHKIQV